jgi:UDP-N-acetylmuramate--alanine ligase
METVSVAKESFPHQRVLLCFQPHHRNRTKSLFLDFVPSFDAADVLVLCEIYDVAGRDAKEDADVSSHDLVDAVVRHDADRGVTRTVEYAADPTTAVRRVLELAAAGDIVICMGAGDIDGAVRANV